MDELSIEAAGSPRPVSAWGAARGVLDAAAVLLLRDPRDSVAAIKLRSGMPERDALLALAGTLERLAAAADAPGVLPLRLEDLHHLRATARITVDEAAGFAAWAPVPGGDGPLWRGVLSAEEAAACETMFRPFLDRFYAGGLPALRAYDGEAARARLAARPARGGDGPGLPWLQGWQFGSSRDGQASLRDGWWGGENGYVWSKDAARLVLPRPTSGACVLRLAGAPYLGSAASRPMEVVVDGRPLGRVDLRGFSVVECDLPAASGGMLDVELRLPEASRPRDDTPGHGDDRRLGFSLDAVELYGTARAAAATRPAALPRQDSLSDEALMLRFESLGENCEFGLVQRRCGAEPLGLLRFSSTPLPRLVAALDRRFAGLGAPGKLEVQLSGGGREYMMYDRAFGFLYHAWVSVGEMAPAEILAREGRRVPFLARKLLEDLAEGEKIFVFHGHEPMTRDEAGRLLDAIRRHGPGTLLWVERADAAHPPGTVRWAEPGLLQGFMDRFAPGDNAHDLSLACWTRVCREAYRLQCGMEAAAA